MLPGIPFAGPDEAFPATGVLHDISIHQNVSFVSQKCHKEPVFSLAGKAELSKTERFIPVLPRPRVTSGANRPALDGSRRSTGKSQGGRASSSTDKENVLQAAVIT